MNIMNRLSKLLVLIASKLLVLIAAVGVGVMGSAQALAQTDAGTLSPTVQQDTNLYATGTTFAEIYNFTIGAEYQTLVSSAVSYQPEGTTAEEAHVSNLTLALYDAGGSELASFSSSNGSMIDLSQALLSGDYSLQVSGIADGSLGGAYQISVAAIPEPAGWVTLVCGLAIVLFMARRKTRLLAGDPAWA